MLAVKTSSKLKDVKKNLRFNETKKQVNHETSVQFRSKERFWLWSKTKVSCVSITEIERRVVRKLTCKVECQKEQKKARNHFCHVYVGKTLKLHLKPKGVTEIYSKSSKGIPVN